MLPLLSLNPNQVSTGIAMPTNKLKLHFEFNAVSELVTLKITKTLRDPSELLQGRISYLKTFTLKAFGQNGTNETWRMTHAQFNRAIKTLSCQNNTAGVWSSKPKPPPYSIQIFHQFLRDTDGSQYVNIVWAIEP